jgi:hypothetical protein
MLSWDSLHFILLNPLIGLLLIKSAFKFSEIISHASHTFFVDGLPLIPSSIRWPFTNVLIISLILSE